MRRARWLVAIPVAGVIHAVVLLPGDSHRHATVEFQRGQAVATQLMMLTTPPTPPPPPKDTPQPVEEIEPIQPPPLLADTDPSPIAQPIQPKRVDTPVEATLPTATSAAAVQPSTPPTASKPSETAAARLPGVTQPAISNSTITPIYPRLSRRHGEEGEVHVQVTLTAHGEVQSTRVVRSSEHPRLDAAAITAVKSATFQPALSDGQPASDTLMLRFQFQLK